ncbi:MAG: hypothetical protein KDE32_01365 [Novosphingobium sp.]|nr:hypothetical protein [Novosphingobium sp.]
MDSRKPTFPCHCSVNARGWHEVPVSCNIRKNIASFCSARVDETEPGDGKVRPLLLFGFIVCVSGNRMTAIANRRGHGAIAAWSAAKAGFKSFNLSHERDNRKNLARDAWFDGNASASAAFERLI